MKKVRCAVANLVTAVLVSSSFLAPVSSAYALEFSSLSNNEAETSGSSSFSDFVSEPTEKTAEADSCNSEVESAAQSAQSSDSSSVDVSFQYLYIAQPSLSLGAMQEAAFATASDSDVLTSATLSFVSNSGEKRSVEASAFSGNAAGFTFGQDLSVAQYFLTGITYQAKDSNAIYSVDLSSEDYGFNVVNSSSSSDYVDNSDDMSVYYADENGNPVEAFSIEEALSGSEGDSGIAAYSVDSRSARKNVRVIALDAGHGGSDPGAQGNGKSEADLTWKIVSACKTKLENYGFKVILAREQSGSYGSNDFLYRVQRCVNQGAQAYISFHINSGSSAAHGAEVYSPTVNGADYTQVSYELAQKVQNNLVALGLTNRGVFQMQVGDEFAVIRCAREAGIPGILIEHGFISNWGDANRYFSDAGCKRLGEADADAIIAQFPKSSWLDYSSVFDADYYLNKYPDVNEWANGSKDKALDHFINYGMSEGRRGSEAFDVYSYKTRYLDLRKAYGSNLKDYYLHYLEYGMKEHRNGSSMTGFEGYIMSSSFTSYEAAAAHYSRTVGSQTFPTSVYKSKGSASIDEFCKILYEEASFEGVCPEVLYAQVMKETGYLRFGNLVQANQCNFGGVGATGPGNPGYTFSSVREGLRVQVQHLKAYATTEPLNNPCIDPRFNLVSRGCAPKTTDLNGRWAIPGKGYGESLNAIVLDVLCV